MHTAATSHLGPTSRRYLPQLAEGAAVTVRYMADAGNTVIPATLLHERTTDAGHPSWAFCSDYAFTLVIYMRELLTVAASAWDHVQYVQLAFNTNGFDTHVLCEFLDPTTGTWFVVDPTFMVTVRRTSDGGRMGVDEISTAVRAKQFSAMTYVKHDPLSTTLLAGYGIDYPLLYLDPRSPAPGAFVPLTPYMTEVSLPLSGPRATYALQSTGGVQTIVAKIDNVTTNLPCDGVEGLSYCFVATSLSITTAPLAYKVMKLNRYTF